MYSVSTKTHGLVDYIVGAAISALPNVLPCRKPAKTIFRMAGLGAGLYSMMTNYERGVVKVLPMEAHLAMDAASGVALVAASMLLKDERPEVRAMMGAVGLFEIAAAAMTTPNVGQPQSEPVAQRLIDYAHA